MRRIVFKGLLITFCLLNIISASHAACFYEQVIEANEFQIGIMLTWKTGAEIDHERFIIEKSENGVDFQEIGTVTGNGTTSDVQDYNFLHIYPRENRVYYRLREIDYDGVITYSDIVVFEIDKPALARVVRLSDAFTDTTFEVKIDSYQEGRLHYQLQDWKGVTILQESLEVINGINDIDIDAKNLPNGIYKLALTIEGEENAFDTLTFKRADEPGKEKVPTAGMQKGN